MSYKNILIVPPSVNFNDNTIRNVLNSLNTATINNNEKKIIIDFSHNSWISAEMTVFLGTIFRNLQNDGFKVMTSGMSKKVRNLLERNGFLKNFGIGDKVDDTNQTVIPFVEIQPKQTKDIENYLNNEVFNAMDLRISQEQNQIIKNAIYELTHNVDEHSKSPTFFMCGQYFPNKNLLTFAISDYGISIPGNIKQNKPLSIDDNITQDCELIEWATREGTSTKKKIVGGLGLFDIREEIQHMGNLRILSEKGFVQFDKDQDILINSYNVSFSGTMIYVSYDLNSTDYSQNINPPLDF